MEEIWFGVELPVGRFKWGGSKCIGLGVGLLVGRFKWGDDLAGRGTTGWVLINGKWTMESGKLF